MKSIKQAVCFCLVLGSLFAVSCSSLQFGEKTTALDELRSAITEKVTDEARREKMLKAVDRMVASIEELNTIADRQRDQVNIQIRDYSTTRKALEATLANNLKERQAIIDNLAKAHYDFKSQAAEEEWKKLSKKEKKALAWVVHNSSEGGA